MRLRGVQVAKRQGWPKQAPAATGCLRGPAARAYARPMRANFVNNANNNNRPPPRVDD
ncbi:hypothetical protein GCM10011521_15070 [Arenimonas soli]|uniref:Uncharacterized protein n=1 Tax=Arenimonas soli TaxID=2269504 RepID=A0ABQ1HIJ3_9GAMM|nr:hypothetical protein GCM10011521_15070 [Arenimonas soli]